MPYGPGGFNHGGSYTQRLAWSGTKGEEMALSREVAQVSTKQKKAEADYAQEIVWLRNLLRQVEEAYQKNNTVDRFECERLIESAFRIYGDARRVEELRELAKQLVQE
jgi:hypothetical protein